MMYLNFFSPTFVFVEEAWVALKKHVKSKNEGLFSPRWKKKEKDRPEGKEKEKEKQKTSHHAYILCGHVDHIGGLKPSHFNSVFTWPTMLTLARNQLHRWDLKAWPQFSNIYIKKKENQNEVNYCIFFYRKHFNIFIRIYYIQSFRIVEYYFVNL